MATVIVITDFSETSRNALQYACSFFAASTHIELLLLNISDVPASYSGDGVAMAAISDTLDSKVQQIKEETREAVAHFDPARVRYRALIGTFIQSLRELIGEEQAVLVIMGTPAAYGELWSWDTDTLSALTELPIPVLTIPAAVEYKPIRNIAFASIPGNLHGSSPMEAIKKLVKYTGAKLHVISVIPPHHDAEKEQEAEAGLRLQLAETEPVCHKIVESHIVQAIGRFVEEQHIDLLVVRPRKHGIWYNLFHKSYARELARLNLIPVMALHEEWKVDG